MDSASFEKLIHDQPPDVKAKGILLFNGALKGQVAYQGEPIVAKLKDWRASESALDEFIASLGVTPTNEKTFHGIPSVVEYLHSHGWKISLRTAYNHRDKKNLLPRKDGKYYQSDVDRYAQTVDLPRLDGIKQEITDSEAERKKRADADIAEYDARIKRIRAEAIEGKYVDRDVFKNELSVQALAFRNSIQTFVHAQAEEIVSFTRGDVSKIPDLIEFMMDRADEHFRKYAEEWEKKGPLIDIEKAAAEDADDEENGES